MSLLASVSSNLKIWDFNDHQNLSLSSTAEFFPKEKSSVTELTELMALSWNHNQQVIAVGGGGQKLHLVQANNGQTLSSLPIDEKDQFVGEIRALSFSHNSRYLASAIDREVAVWDLKKRSIRVRLTGHKAALRALQFSNEGYIFSGDTSGAMLMWNVESSSRSKELLNPGYRSPLNSLRMSPHGNRHVCCGYGDGSVTVWDTTKLAAVNRCKTAHGSAVTSLAYSPQNDRLILTGGKDGEINIVDLGATYDKYSVAMNLNVRDPVTSVSFHESELYSAVGTSSGFIHIYDWRNSRKPVGQFPAHNPMSVNEIAFQQSPPARSHSKSSKKSAGVAASVQSSIETVSSLDMTNVSEEPKNHPTPSTAECNSKQFEEKRIEQTENASSIHSFASGNRAAAKLQQGGESFLHHLDTAQIKKTDNVFTGPSHQEREPPSHNSSNTQKNSMSAEKSYKAHSHLREQDLSLQEENNDIENHIREQIRPVTKQELSEAMQLIQYDIHKEVHAVIREQVRQFSIAKDETAALLSQLSEQLKDVLQANKELRAENERLRKIY